MKTLIKNLCWFDLLILSAILMGNSIYTSTEIFIGLFKNSSIMIGKQPDFSTWDNIYSLIYQLLFLGIAIGYLAIRKFDFSQWKIKFSIKAVGFGIALFAIISLCMDLFMLSSYSFFPQNTAETTNTPIDFF